MLKIVDLPVQTLQNCGYAFYQVTSSWTHLIHLLYTSHLRVVEASLFTRMLLKRCWKRSFDRWKIFSARFKSGQPPISGVKYSSFWEIYMQLLGFRHCTTNEPFLALFHKQPWPSDKAFIIFSFISLHKWIMHNERCAILELNCELQLKPLLVKDMSSIVALPNIGRSIFRRRVWFVEALKPFSVVFLLLFVWCVSYI